MTTIRQIKKVQPKSAGFLEIHFNRVFSKYITWLMLRMGITPNQVNFLSFFISVIAAGFLATGEWTYLVISGILIQLSYTLDCCDGEIARLKKMANAKGAWQDSSLDRISEFILFLALGWGLLRQTGDQSVWFYTFVAFGALFMTHVMTLQTAKTFGKEKLAKTQKGGIGGVIKRFKINPYYLTIGIDLHMMIFALGAVFNQLMLINYFFIYVQNAYWLLIFVLILFKKEK